MSSTPSRTPSADPTVVAVRVKPGASRTAVGGAYHGLYGAALVVSVTAPAVDGRATDAALRALARALGVRAGQVTLRVGAASRDKLFAVERPPTDLAERVDALRAATR